VPIRRAAGPAATSDRAVTPTKPIKVTQVSQESADLMPRAGTVLGVRVPDADGRLTSQAVPWRGGGRNPGNA
jgi:hypothetical protein